MTLLDVVCWLFLALVGIGGYAQGLIRGVLRLLALLGGAVMGTLFALRVGSTGTAPGAAGWAGVMALLGIAVCGLVAWSAAKAIPPFVHRTLINRLLGVLPALLLGLLILALGLGLAERVVVASETQAYIRSGWLTGPLIGAVDVAEQIVAGVR